MALSKDEIKVKNTLNLYDTLTLNQILSLCNLKTNHQKQIITTLLKKKAIKKDYLIDGIDVYTNFFSQANRKFALIGEVLKKIIDSLNTPVVWFQKQEYPFVALTFIKDKMFDITVIEKGEEHIFNSIINRILSSETGEKECIIAPAPRENILIIIEDISQIEKIKIIHKNVIFAYVNLKEEKVKFIK